MIGNVYLFAAAIAFWLGRKERLKARWPMVILVLHATLLLVGLGTGADVLPAVLSWFGFIHFEGVVFSLGTTVFLLALVKERSESGQREGRSIEALTGIANRGAFMEIAKQVVGQCRHEDAPPLRIIMCDLDRFKAINDTHGHAVDDAVLKKFCETVRDVLWSHDVFGILGGEEFAIVFAASEY